MFRLILGAIIPNGILGATEQKHFYISPKEQPANGEAWWWQH